MFADRRWVPAAVLVAVGVLVVTTGDRTESPTSNRAIQPAPAAPLPGPTVVTTPEAASAEEVAKPAWVEVPTIGVRTDLLSLDLNPDRTLEVPGPADVDRAGWYRHSARPGGRGPAVIVGHLDSRDGPAVFHRLAELRPDDEIRIGRTDGTTVSFLVVHVGQYAKADFPTRAVYAATAGSELRLITCGGTYHPDDGGYQDNVIVFAVAAT